MERLTLPFRFESIILLIFVTIQVEAWSTHLKTTNHISGWIPMKSNNNSLCHVAWKHYLNDVPLRVDIQVRPVSGPDSSYYFPGIGSAQRDGIIQSPYGGVLYKYNNHSVMMYAPNRLNAKSTGYAIYTGDQVWNGIKIQQESSVLTRVRVWGEEHFPQPDFNTSWIPIKIGDGYKEIQHGLGVQPMYVIFQIKLGTTGDVADGIGYTMTMDSRRSSNNWGGVLYAYNNTTIRYWTNYFYGHLFTVTDGWGVTTEEYNTGFVRILAWKSMNGQKVERQLIKLPSAINKEIILQDSINQTCDIVQVMIKETSNGANNGFLFKATGAVQNTASNNSYGGVVYSYSSKSLRLWYPPVTNHSKQYFIYIDNMYGGIGHNSVAESVELEIITIKPHGTCSPTIRTALKTTTAQKTIALATTKQKTAALATTKLTTTTLATTKPKTTALATTKQKTAALATTKLTTTTLATTKPKTTALATTKQKTAALATTKLTTTTLATTKPKTTALATTKKLKTTTVAIPMTTKLKTTTVAIPKTTKLKTTTVAIPMTTKTPTTILATTKQKTTIVAIPMTTKTPTTTTTTKTTTLATTTQKPTVVTIPMTAKTPTTTTTSSAMTTSVITTPVPATLIALTTTTPKRTSSVVTTATPTTTTASVTRVARTKDITATKKVCNSDFWIWILVGFCSCLILVIIMGLFWYCIRSKVKHKIWNDLDSTQKDPDRTHTRPRPNPRKQEVLRLEYI